MCLDGKNTDAQSRDLVSYYHIALRDALVLGPIHTHVVNSPLTMIRNHGET